VRRHERSAAQRQDNTPQHAVTPLRAGCVHVLTGPDHLSAISMLASGGSASRWRAAWLGVRWGLGHRRAQRGRAAPRMLPAALALALASRHAAALTHVACPPCRSAGLLVVAAVFFGLGQRMSLHDVSDAGARGRGGAAHRLRFLTRHRRGHRARRRNAPPQRRAATQRADATRRHS
jgi:hypothetical protein